MSHKKTISEIIKDKNLCKSGFEKFSGKSLDEIVNNPDCGMNWIAAFASRVADEEGWPTKEELVAKALSEVNLYKDKYKDPKENWIDSTLESIQGWIDGEVTLEEMEAIGKENISKTRLYDERSKEIFFSKAVSILSTCPKTIRNLTLVYEFLSSAIGLDEDIEKTKKEALNDMTERFDTKCVVNNKLKENVK